MELFVYFHFTFVKFSNKDLFIYMKGWVTEWEMETEIFHLLMQFPESLWLRCIRGSQEPAASESSGTQALLLPSTVTLQAASAENQIENGAGRTWTDTQMWCQLLWWLNQLQHNASPWISTLKKNLYIYLKVRMSATERDLYYFHSLVHPLNGCNI